MRRLPVLLASIALALALACSSTHAQSSATSPAPKSSTIHVMSSDGKPITPTYQDTKGNIIDAQAFTTATKQGQRFEMKPDPNGEGIIFALLPPGATGGNSLTATQKPSQKVGKPLPEFQLPTVAGGHASPTTLTGKQTVVDFFFADCVACIEELPALNAYAAQHPDMNFLAITFDDATIAKAFVQNRHFDWPVAYDGKPLMNKLSITAFPTMMLLDKTGHVLASHSGSIPVSYTQTAAEAAKHTPPPKPSASARKKAQLQWLGKWVDTNHATHAN